MKRSVHEVVEGLMDEEILALYQETARILDILQVVEEIGGWQRPEQPVLETIRGLCKTLLQRVAAVHEKTLAREEVWER